MSFSSYTTYADDKTSDLFGQSYEDLNSDFFDQFLTFSPIDNEGPDYPLLPESTLSERSTLDTNSQGTSPSSQICGVKDSSVQVRDELWASTQNTASFHPSSAPGSHFYSELSGRAATSDSELLCLESITLYSPHSETSPFPSLPSSPPLPAATPARRKFHVAESLSKTFKKVTGSLEKSLRSPIRKASSSPKMMRTTQSFQNNLDVWGNKLNSKFQFDFEHPVGPLSPPQSARPSNASENPNTARFLREDHHDAFSYSHGLPHQFAGRSESYDTPLATPILDAQHSRRASMQHPFSDAMHFPPTPQYQHDSVSWPQITGQSDFNAYGTPALHSPGIDAPVWWSHAATAPMAQPSPTSLHINPQRATTSLAHQLQNELSFNSNELACSSTSKMPSGLMIQMPESPVLQSFVMGSSHSQHQAYFGHTQAQPEYHLASRPFGQTLSREPESCQVHESHSGTSESDSPSPKSSPHTFNIRKRRTSKVNKNTPRTPVAGGAVDFVNFTPNDRRKILTGVAPSGSSKTKARREKEAMEKRRKLSQAALRAVQAVGGDVESLVEQGLFV